MTKVNGTSISMTRGDSLQVQVSITLNGGSYTPQNGDVLTFFLKHRAMNQAKTAYSDANPLVTKDIPIATMVLALGPADTKPLDFGEYVYDIQITFANGIVDTFINNARFTLLPEVG